MQSNDSLVLDLPAEPENLARVRDAVSRRAREMGMSDIGVSDLTTAVSEACANVVLHAYPSDARAKPMQVRLAPEGSMVRISVADSGRGLRPMPEEGAGGHLGLLLIGALANCFQLRSSQENGTELRAKFSLRKSR